MTFRVGLSCGVALAAVMAGGGAALAADFTIVNGQTVNVTQALSDQGDVGVIEAGGRIATVSPGVDMGNNNQTVINNGLVETMGPFSPGILARGVDALIINNGQINIGATASPGILVDGHGARIENRGSIVNTGDMGDYDPVPGIRINGDDAVITNTGYIYAEGITGWAILSVGSNTLVINSGRIISAESSAFLLNGSGATLKLLAGSVIQGAIRINNPDTATLDVGPGLNTALTFIGTPETINTYGPSVTQGSLVAVVDPTGFSAQDEMLTDLTRAVSGAVDGRLNAARFGYVPMAGSVTAYAEADTQPTAFGYATGAGAASSIEGGFWAAGIGSWRNQDADGADVGFDTSLGGLMVGYDTVVSGGTRVGGFLGASTSRFETDANSQEIDADSYFGGLYAGFTGQNYFLDVALTGGVSQQSSDRTVANNLVLGGIEHATADYDGVFISPSATIGTTLAMANGSTFIPTFRARYAGLFLDGYDESGSAANLSVDDRDVNIFDLRAQLAYALAALPSGNGAVHATFRIGADATFADNANVDAALLGTALNFDVSGDDTLRGFAGVDLNYRTDGGSSFFLGAEAGYDTGDAFTLDVQGGLRIPL
ncbi:MAG: autotransporter domain-containing protein [Mesorhizobium sp.]|nr:autotransporter outer membrane beta-barrel domain-containing protein [Mesorhizobium sp.]MBL8578759.1 autotransporter domain-containing protein [Mesorhizobium sp.]